MPRFRHTLADSLTDSLSRTGKHARTHARTYTHIQLWKATLVQSYIRYNVITKSLKNAIYVSSRLRNISIPCSILFVFFHFFGSFFLVNLHLYTESRRRRDRHGARPYNATLLTSRISFRLALPYPSSLSYAFLSSLSNSRSQPCLSTYEQARSFFLLLSSATPTAITEKKKRTTSESIRNIDPRYI